VCVFSGLWTGQDVLCTITTNDAQSCYSMVSCCWLTTLDRLFTVLLLLQVADIIQMTHDGECGMLKYIRPEVEMNTRACPSVDILTEGHIYLHVTRVHHASFVLSYHWL